VLSAPELALEKADGAGDAGLTPDAVVLFLQLGLDAPGRGHDGLGRRRNVEVGGEDGANVSPVTREVGLLIWVGVGRHCCGCFGVSC